MVTGDTDDRQLPSLWQTVQRGTRWNITENVHIYVALCGAVEFGRGDGGAVELEGDATTKDEANGTVYAGVGGNDVLHRIEGRASVRGMDEGGEGKRTGACLAAGAATEKLAAARQETRAVKIIIVKRVEEAYST